MSEKHNFHLRERTWQNKRWYFSNSTHVRLFSEYENGCVYLAESAQILTQNTVYEIPAVKKNNQKLEQIQLESDKKEETAGKRILELDEEFRLDARQIFNPQGNP